MAEPQLHSPETHRDNSINPLLKIELPQADIVMLQVDYAKQLGVNKLTLSPYAYHIPDREPEAVSAAIVRLN